MSRRRAPERPLPALPWSRSFVFAAAGLRRAWRSERNLRVQCALGWLVLGTAALAGLSAARAALLLAVVGMVLGMEIMNSAVELIVDLASPQRHPLAEAVKDLAAGAVLTVSVGALAAGVAAFWPVGALPGAVALGVRAHPLIAAVWCAGVLALAGAAAASLPGRPQP
jgi:undecaprenol kinase